MPHQARSSAPLMPPPVARASGGSRSGRLPPYERLKRAILAGELEPGQPLVEANLAKWAEVSRTPVREALRRLEQDGLVERGSHGLAVRARSPEEILDIYDTRVVLEATAARVAAERRTEHDLRLLRLALERGRAANPTDDSQLVEANDAFHRAIWRASRNESLVDLLERLALHLGRYPRTTLSAEGRWEATQQEHADLAEAIEQRDGARAHQIAERHFLAARDIRLKLFDAAASERD